MAFAQTTSDDFFHGDCFNFDCLLDEVKLILLSVIIAIVAGLAVLSFYVAKKVMNRKTQKNTTDNIPWIILREFIPYF
mgnify:FL=1